MANGQWLIAINVLSHPDSNRRYRNFTDSVLLGKLLLHSTFEESWTITTGREFHPAPSIRVQR